MKIVVIGGNGGTGEQVVRRAAAEGHEVVAFSRRGSHFSFPGVTNVSGDARDLAAVRPVIAGADAVVVALGASGGTKAQVRTAATATVVRAMQEAGVRRLVVHSTYGTGDSADQAPPVVKVLIRTVLGRAVADHNAQEDVARTSGLDWTIVRPVGLTDEPATGAYLAQSAGDPTPIASQISRADVADFIVRALADDTTIGRAVTLAQPRA